MCCYSPRIFARKYGICFQPPLQIPSVQLHNGFPKRESPSRSGENASIMSLSGFSCTIFSHRKTPLGSFFFFFLVLMLLTRRPLRMPTSSTCLLISQAHSRRASQLRKRAVQSSFVRFHGKMIQGESSASSLRTAKLCAVETHRIFPAAMCFCFFFVPHKLLTLRSTMLITVHAYFSRVAQRSRHSRVQDCVRPSHYASRSNGRASDVIEALGHGWLKFYCILAHI